MKTGVRNSQNKSKFEQLLLEESLGELLKPVSPRLDFVENLRTRLFSPGPESIIESERKDYSIIWIAIAGIISGGTLLYFGIRSLIALIQSTGRNNSKRHNLRNILEQSS
jgi:hypothetical protein